MRGVLRNSARIGAIVLVFGVVLALSSHRRVRRDLRDDLAQTVDDINARLAHASLKQGRIYPYQRTRHA